MEAEFIENFKESLIFFCLFLLLLAIIRYIITYPKIVSKKQYGKMKKEGQRINNKNYVILRLIEVLNNIKAKK